MHDSAMKSQKEVNYRTASMPGRQCENCPHFMDGGNCTLVYGHILWNHTCDLFEWKPLT